MTKASDIRARRFRGQRRAKLKQKKSEQGREHDQGPAGEPDESNSAPPTMSGAKRIAEFPDVEAKLQQPTKKSAFERQRAEAEAKRQREAAETAAVYEDFVKSFDDDGDNDRTMRPGDRPPPQRFDRPASMGQSIGAGRRHFGIPSGPSGLGLKSGPGSLGPVPSSYGNKRSYDGFKERKDRDDGRGRLGFDSGESTSISKAFDASDDEEDTKVAGRAEEKAVSKPTLRLSNLPPGTSPAAIKALVPPSLAVESVKILSSTGVNSNERKSATAIVTLSMETAASEIDAAVSAMQNRYLGFGYYLSLHRHLSSAAISGALTNLNTPTTVAHPFGAKPVPEEGNRNHRSHMGRGGSFAPPPQYGPPGSGMNRSGILHVPVKAPKDVKQLRMIHKVVEGVLEHGAEFEALLMSRSDVQRDEKWAWIWDARSEGGIWYRYRLWEVISGSRPVRGQGKFMPLFEGSHAWKMPDNALPYEYNTKVDEFVSDSEYNSSDDDDFEDEPTRPGEGPGNDQEEGFMSPLERSKLTHLLARLPDSLTKLRKGDIARITTFAIKHANRGSDEIVDMVVSNVERPFFYSHANPAHKPNNDQEPGGPDRNKANTDVQDDKTSADVQDMSTAKLIGLYVISDILSSSSTSGVRHAWRYRQLFEANLKNRKIFEGLGLMAEQLSWGRMRADKWKRSVGLVLGLWEGWCVFPAETQALLVDTFENPPSAKKEKADDDASKKGRWKSMGGSAAKSVEESAFKPLPVSVNADSDGVPDRMDEAIEGDSEGDYDILYYTDDEDLDLAALDEDGIDGKPLSGDALSGRLVDGSEMEELIAKLQLRNEQPREHSTATAA